MSHCVFLAKCAFIGWHCVWDHYHDEMINLIKNKLQETLDLYKININKDGMALHVCMVLHASMEANNSFKLTSY